MTFFDSNNLSGGNRPAGFDPRLILDFSIIEVLRKEGYILTPTSFNIKTAINSFQVIKKTVLGGRSIPAFSDQQGNVYIVDEKQIVYLLEKSRVNPTTGVPTNTTPTQTNTPVLPNPPLAQPSPTPIIAPGLVVPSSGGGNSVIGSGKIYTRFTTDDVVPNQQETVTRALWSNNVGNLLTFFTSSAQTTNQKQYYYEIFNSGSQSDCGASAQFSVAYGHRLGSGSADEGGQIEDTPSRAIYGQNRLLCLDSDKQYFTIGGSTTEHIYIINVNRSRMREALDEGNVEINLAYLSGSEYVAGGEDADTYTGSAVTVGGDGQVLRLIDDSSINPASIMQSGEVYNMVSGSIEDGVYNSESPHIFGQLFKRKGIIVLDATKLDSTASFGTVTGREINGDNAYKLYTAISGAALYTDQSGDYLGFQGRGSEKVKSTHYFVRAKNSEYNFSNNPTFITGSEGDLRHPSMHSDPKTYITTIGLYNNNEELVAVAKMSQAVQKAFTKEALIEIKLEFAWIIGLFGSMIGMFV